MALMASACKRRNDESTQGQQAVNAPRTALQTPVLARARLRQPARTAYPARRRTLRLAEAASKRPAQTRGYHFLLPYFYPTLAAVRKARARRLQARTARFSDVHALSLARRVRGGEPKHAHAQRALGRRARPFQRASRAPRLQGRSQLSGCLLRGLVLAVPPLYTQLRGV